MIFDDAGNLYGTTAYGGIGDNGGYGTVFSVRSPGTPCSTALCRGRKTVLYTFTGGSDGVTPNEYGGSLVFDKAGNIYGTTTNGGLLECEQGGSTRLWHGLSALAFRIGLDGERPLPLYRRQ